MDGPRHHNGFDTATAVYRKSASLCIHETYWLGNILKGRLQPLLDDTSFQAGRLLGCQQVSSRSIQFQVL